MHDLLACIIYMIFRNICIQESFDLRKSKHIQKHIQEAHDLRKSKHIQKRIQEPHDLRKSEYVEKHI